MHAANSGTGWALAIVGLSVVLVAAFSRRLSGTPLTPAIVVVALGLLAGPLVLDKLTAAPTSSLVRTLAEATLAVVLFSDASRIDLHALRRDAAIPARLLGIGLPLTIAGGALAAAALFPSLSLSEVAMLGVILAPTDAGLGSAVVTDERLPQRVRQSLNVESGLNDGLCVPLLLLAIATAAGPAESAHPAQLLAEEVGYGALAGGAVGLLTGGVVVAAERLKLIDTPWLQLVPIAAAASSFGVALALGGSGFIAAFVAGLVYGLTTRGEKAEEMRFTEEAGLLLDAVTFLVFGAVLLSPALEEISWRFALYAVLSLTVVRMVPVALAMLRSGARWQTVSFIGWFGPRGLASIVFAVIVEDADPAHAPTILTAAYLTVGLSVLVHGLSAAPLVDRYSSWYARHGRVRAKMESESSPEHRPRRSWLARYGQASAERPR
ncbi:MAG TPA: cation:proton antiporter [Solirubrobacteraceae bacterium]|nr:cation:proton antiporter [Solirubrobacteraceae bacterium]